MDKLYIDGFDFQLGKMFLISVGMRCCGLSLVESVQCFTVFFGLRLYVHIKRGSIQLFNAHRTGGG